MAALKGQEVLGTADGIPELGEESRASYVPWGDVRTVSAARPGRRHGNGRSHHRLLSLYVMQLRNWMGCKEGSRNVK